MHNPKNEFYSDVCTQHTSDEGTDMTLFDRKDQYNAQNMSLCESGCEFQNYNEETGKVKCECPIKTGTNFYGIDPNKLLDKFKNVKSIINIMIVKCAKLVFSSDGLKKNIGSYTILVITSVSILLTMLFYKIGFSKFKNFINKIFDKKFKEKNINNPEYPPKKEGHKKRKSINEDKKRNSVFNNNAGISTESKDILKVNKMENNKDKNLKRKSTIKDNKEKEKKKSRKSLKSSFDSKIIEKSDGNNIDVYLNDYELNNLSFEEAIKYDKRTLWQYYFSLLKTKHLIIFTFYTKTDYNSRLLKIILFLLSFTLYYIVNALFFTDSTMHQIYEDEGAFNFVYQIPQILYSTIISTVIKMIISFLSLTEKNFTSIKKDITIEEAKKEIKKKFNSASKKFIAFFSINFLLLIIFWYYLSCFCAVYKNTQVYLIKDTLLSFAISLLYPFALNFLPAILRIPAIKSKKKCLFVVSTYVAII